MHTIRSAFYSNLWYLHEWQEAAGLGSEHAQPWEGFLQL